MDAMEKRPVWKTMASAAVLIIIGVLAAFLLFAWSNGEFDSIDSLKAYIARFGAFGPVMLTLIQAAQVVLPVLPGFLGCAAGGVLFGPAVGFLCNYIGISAGSILAFYLARVYGLPLVRMIFPQRYFETWERRINRWNCLGLVMFVATLLPLFPDDFLCYFCGLTKMRGSKFVWIILLGKPWCILVYSLIFGGAL